MPPYRTARRRLGRTRIDSSSLVRRRRHPRLGLAHLWVVLGLSVAMQFILADSTSNSEVGGWLQTAPLAWLVGVAVSGVVTLAAAVMSGLVVRAARTFGALVTLWVGSAALSALALVGHLDGRAVLLALACAGLALGVSVAPPSLSGASIFAIGASYVWLHLIVLWSNYYSLGAEFTVAARWTGGRVVATAPADLPFPEDPMSRLFALVSTASAGPSSGYSFLGLTGNPNLTGNYLAPILAFMAAFTLRATIGDRNQLQKRHRHHGLRRLRGTRRVPAACACRANSVDRCRCLHRGGAMAHAEARTDQARCRAFLAVLLPVAVIAAPPTLSAAMNLRLSGRSDCVWESWWHAVGLEPVWGNGPGTLPSTCGLEGMVVARAQRVLQSWSLGGLVGLLSFVLLIAFLTWFALGFSDRDGRALVAVLTCCLVLFGMEVVTPFFENAVALGLATIIAVAGRSLRLMTASRFRSQAQSRMPR